MTLKIYVLGNDVRRTIAMVNEFYSKTLKEEQELLLH